MALPIIETSPSSCFEIQVNMAPLRFLGGTSRTLRWAARPYHASPALCHPYKDSQDRETLRPRSAQNTKSGRDDDVAANEDAAFNPHKTSPETEYDTAAAGRDAVNPLEASGANQPLSMPHGDEKKAGGNGPGKEVRKGGASGGGGAPKNKPVERV